MWKAEGVGDVAHSYANPGTQPSRFSLAVFEPGVGSAVLKLGFKSTCLPATGLAPSSLIARLIPAARLSVLTRATRVLVGPAAPARPWPVVVPDSTSPAINPTAPPTTLCMN